MESKRIRLDTSQVNNDTLLFNMPIMGSNTNKQMAPNISNVRFQNLASIVDPNLINKAAVANNNIIIRSASSRSQLNNSSNSNARSVQQAVVLPSTNFQPLPTNNILRLSNSQPFNYTGHNNATNNNSNNNPSNNNNNNPSNNNSNNSGGGGGNVGSISIPAIQVRIGSKKFKPISNVTFKDDGILFTLKDYSFAPVLLNARAIQRCKANLTTYGYPVLFLFLESSCMRQIRNIFSLTHKEFSANAVIEFKQCITIFPHLSCDSRNSAEQMMFGLRKAFEAMVKRYPRNTAILEVISDEQVIDTLLMSSQEKPDSSETINNNNNNTNNNSNNNNNANSNTNNTTNNTNNNNNNSNNSSRNNSVNSNTSNNTPNNNNNNSNNANNNNTYRHTQPRPIQAAPPPPLPPQPQPPSNTHLSPNPPSLLTIPTDKALWQAMQKNLVRGSLYHVQMPDSQRKYCIWDGVQLVPCLVQNTEVQVECTYVRFGTSLHTCEGAVKVRADHNAGISFAVKGTKSDKVVDIWIGVQDMVVNQFHPSSHHSCIFVSITPTASERISSALELHEQAAAGNKDAAAAGGGGSGGGGNNNNNNSGGGNSGGNSNNSSSNSSNKGNSVFDCNSCEMSKKYIIIFLKALNKDQEDALLSMKLHADTSYLKKNTHLFVKLDVFTTLNLLAKIVENSVDEAKRLLDSLSPLGPHTLDKLLKRLTVGSNTSVHNVDDDDDDDGDDDDDDVLVMVQHELGIKCPYTQQVMQEPVRNMKCGHNYEKQAILQFINIKKGNAKCPYAGCANAECLTLEGLEDNLELKEHISKLNAASHK